MFDSGVPQSAVLWGTEIPKPHNHSKFSDEATQTYIAAYHTSQLIGCTPRRCHTNAMDEVKRNHKLRGGVWS